MASGETTPGGRRDGLKADLLRPLALWLSDVHGEAELDAAAREAGLDLEVLRNPQGWVSREIADRWLEAVRARCDSDDAFREASGHRLADAFGVGRLVTFATTPKQVLKSAFEVSDLSVTGARFRLLEEGPRLLRVRYVPEHPESRLMCLSRTGRGEALPTLWGLPRAHVVERACVAHGDPHCEYEMRFLQDRGWLPAILGVAGGLAVAAAGVVGGVLPVTAWVTFPILFGLAAHVVESRHANLANLQIAGEIAAALRTSSREEADIRGAMLTLQTTLRDRINALEHQRAADQARLRGFSHDLRNPLAVLRLQSEALRRHIDGMGATGLEEHLRTLDDLEALVSRMLRGLSTELKEQTNSVVRTAEIERRLARQLRAQTLGGNVVTSVHRLTCAPETIEIDRVVLDRVLDNLVSNAVKYTERGHIEVELAGADGGGILLVRVSDTGRGIERADLYRIFEPHGSDPATRKPGSHGLGLSVVVDLLKEIGGQLEVETSLGEGTTFWCRVPVCRASTGDRDASLLEDVVSVRPVTVAGRSG